MRESDALASSFGSEACTAGMFLPRSQVASHSIAPGNKIRSYDGGLNMLPNFVLPETTAQKNGSGPAFELGASRGGQLLLTLGITRIIEQESLDVEIWGSADNESWGERPLLRFPQKFYCGTYTLLLDMSKVPDVKYLRVDYKVNRWGRGDGIPLFSFYVFAQTAAPVSNAELCAAVA